MMLRTFFLILTITVLSAVVGVLYFYDYSNDQYLSYLGKVYPVRSGYVLATHYSGKLQDLGKLQESLSNVLTLQCWAFSLPVSVIVVEPHLINESYFGVELESGRTTGKRQNKASRGDKLALLDLFNKRQWRRYALKQHLSGLVGWYYFLKYAPKKMILVDKVCSTDSSSCMKCNKSDTLQFAKSSYKFAQKHNFTIVRRTCYDDSHQYSKEEFQHLIYGNHEPDETVVLFNRFEGFNLKSNEQKISLSWKQCRKFDKVVMPTSPQIRQLSSKYVRKFLHESTPQKVGYIGVMFSVESFARRRHFKGKSRMWQMVSMRKCVSHIVKKVENLKRMTKISSIFLTTDMERLMSYNMSKEVLHEQVLQMGQKELHQRLFGMQLNLTSMTQSVAPLKIPYYLKLLEATIASNGTCLVLAGGSIQQKMSAVMYKATHKKWQNNPTCRVERITEC